MVGYGLDGSEIESRGDKMLGPPTPSRPVLRGVPCLMCYEYQVVPVGEMAGALR